MRVIRLHHAHRLSHPAFAPRVWPDPTAAKALAGEQKSGGTDDRGTTTPERRLGGHFRLKG